jgi:hypothetical protein
MVGVDFAREPDAARRRERTVESRQESGRQQRRRRGRQLARYNLDVASGLGQ